jgi:hypothetical protein
MDEESGYVHKRARWTAVSSVSDVCVVNGAPKTMMMPYKRRVAGSKKKRDWMRG